MIFFFNTAYISFDTPIPKKLIYNQMTTCVVISIINSVDRTHSLKSVHGNFIRILCFVQWLFCKQYTEKFKCLLYLFLMKWIIINTWFCQAAQCATLKMSNLYASANPPHRLQWHLCFISNIVLENVF